MKFKILLTALFIGFIIVGCNSNNNTETKTKTEESSAKGKFEFEKKTHDFGEIKQGEIVVHSFKYKNVGKGDLIIQSVRASCGCTVPKWSREPLAPGKSSEIVVEFDSSGRHGGQHKTVRILSNAEEKEIDLTFSAEVIVQEQ